jgi:glycosyltransferase involved in cell wall biosynthesis
MNKRILFVIPTLKNGGGTIRSLQNILLHLNQEYKIDVLPMFYYPFDIVKLEHCKILPYQASLMALGTNIKDLNHLNDNLIVLNLLLRKIILFAIRRMKLLNKLFPLLTRKSINKINQEEYDTIVAFQEGLPTIFCSFINNTKNKVAWIHSNYEEYKKVIKTDEFYIYQKFNQIVCVSMYTKNSFINIYPLLENQTDFIYNTLDENYLKLKSKERIDDKRFNNSDFTLISIGRIDPVKQFSLLPEIASKLKQHHIKFKWYLLGDGDQNELNKILSNIAQYKVEDCFFYLGSKFNPYPYIAKSSLLVSSSISEACPYVVNEAKVLGIPVVSTNYGSSYEFINHEENGFITTIEEMDLTLLQIINNSIKYNQVKNNLSNFTYNNKVYINKIIDIL